MNAQTQIIPEIVDQAIAAGCKNEAEVIGYLAAEVSRLRSLAKKAGDE